MELLLLLILVGFIIYQTIAINSVRDELYRFKAKTQKKLDLLQTSKPEPKEQNELQALEQSFTKNENTTKAEISKVDSIEASFIADNSETPENVLPQKETKQNTDFVDWMGSDILMKIGAFFVLLGGIWLLSYLYINELISLSLIVFVGILAGYIVMFFGDRTIKTKSVPGQVIMILGASIATISITAGSNLFDVLNLETSFALLLITVIILLFRAITYNAKTMAITGVIGLYCIPLLLGSLEPDYMFLANYSIIIALASVAINTLKEWKGVLTTTIIGTLFYSTVFTQLGDLESVYAFIYIGFFFLGSIIHTLTRKSEVDGLDITNSVLGNVVSLIFIISYIPNSFQNIVLLVMAVLSALTCYIYKYIGKHQQMIVSQFLFMCVYILAFVLREFFDNALLPLILSGGLAGMTLLSAQTLKQKLITSITTISQFVPIYFTLFTFGTDDYLTNLVGVTFFLGINTYILLIQSKDETITKTSIGGILFTAHLLLWESVRRMVGDNSIAAAISLIIYSMTPVALLYKYQIKDQFWMWFSWIVLGFVIIRLLTVELFQMSLLMRIISFTIIGIVFILTAFLSKKDTKK